MILRKMMTKKVIRRGAKVIYDDYTTPNDELMDGGTRIGLSYREAGSSLIWIAEVSQAEQAEALALLKARDNKLEGTESDYADRVILKAPIITGEHDDTSETE